MKELLKKLKISERADKYICLPLYLLVFSFVTIMIAESFAFRDERLVSLGTWGIFFSVALGALLKLLSKEKSLDDLWYIGLLVYSVVFSIIITKSYSKSNIVDGVMFLELPLLLYYVDKRDRKKLLDFVFFVFVALAVFFMLLRLHPLAKTVPNDRWGPRPVETLTLAYSNPNQTAMYLLTCLFVLIYGMYYYKNKLLRVMFFVLSAVVTFFIFETMCRAVLLLSIVLWAFALFHAKIKVKTWIVLVAFLLPILFVLFLVNFEFLYGNLTFLGDSFDTGRVNIYRRVFYFLDLMTAPFGNYVKFSFDNMHNAFMSIFATLGALGVCLFIFFFIEKFVVAYFNVDNKIKRIPYFCIVLLLIHACVESAFFVSGSIYAVGAIIPFLLCNSTAKREGPLYEDNSRKLF